MSDVHVHVHIDSILPLECIIETGAAFFFLNIYIQYSIKTWMMFCVFVHKYTTHQMHEQ